MTATMPISLNARRQLAYLDDAEPAARAEGRLFDLVLKAQRLACADRADGLFLMHACDIAAIRRKEPAAVACIEAAIGEHLIALAANAATLAEAQGLTTEKLQQMIEITQHGFKVRLGFLIIHAAEESRA